MSPRAKKAAPSLGGEGHRHLLQRLGDSGQGEAFNGFFCLRPKKSSDRLRAGPVWPTCISGDVSIDSGDRAEFVEQVSKDFIWENVRNEPKVRVLSSPWSLGSLRALFLLVPYSSVDVGFSIVFLGVQWH